MIDGNFGLHNNSKSVYILLFFCWTVKLYIFLQSVTCMALGWWMQRPWWKRQNAGNRFPHSTSVWKTLINKSGIHNTVGHIDNVIQVIVNAQIKQFSSCRTIRPEHVVRSVYKATGCTDNANHHVIYLEHVVVRITITHPRRGDLSINLTSPSGTKSQLLANRYNIKTILTTWVHWSRMNVYCGSFLLSGGEFPVSIK